MDDDWIGTGEIAMITVNHLTDGNTQNTVSTTTASITPAANKLVLVAVIQSNDYTGASTAPTVSGCGLTWVEVAHADDGTTNANRATVFRGMGASPTTGVLTIAFPGAPANEFQCDWSVDEFDKVIKTGSNGAGAVKQSATNTATSSASSLTVTLAAFSNTQNVTYGAFLTLVNTVFHPGSGFTQLATRNTGNTNMGVEWKNSNDTSVDASWDDASTARAGVAVEIGALSTGGLLSLL